MGRQEGKIVEERVAAIEKDTGKYVTVIKRTIYDNEIPWPTIMFLNENNIVLEQSYLSKLRFDIDVNWERRRYEIVRDMMVSMQSGGGVMGDTEVEYAIFIADLVINKLKNSQNGKN
jgi:hypothetical protein